MYEFKCSSYIASSFLNVNTYPVLLIDYLYLDTPINKGPMKCMTLLKTIPQQVADNKSFPSRKAHTILKMTSYMVSSLNFDLDRCVTLRRFEMESFKCPRVRLVYGKNEEFLYLDIAIVGRGGRCFTIERIRPYHFHEPDKVSGKIIDIHYFKFEFKSLKDAEVFWKSYNEAYDKAYSCDVASMANTFASSFEIIDPTSSDSDTECSSFCWISQDPSLSSDDESDSDNGSGSESEESDNDSEKLRSAL